MDFALALSRRSTCDRAQVGAIVVSEDNHRILAMGYNGSYKGGPNRCDTTVPGACGCLHAEDNCLLKMNFNESCKKKMYLTDSPCVPCAKRIINAGIDEVIYLREYRIREGLNLVSDQIYVRKLEEEFPKEP